jgi:type IV pilus assembly protein PilP
MLLSVLSGCTYDMTDLDRDIDKMYENARRYKIKPLPPYVEAQPYRYNKLGLRDPFRPPFTRNRFPGKISADERARRCKGAPIPNPRRPREILESYSLDSLRMVGILNQKGVTWALLQSKDGTIHRVRKGNYIGQNHGKIVGVSDSEVKVSEIVENLNQDDIAYNGGCPYRSRQASVALSK